MQVAGASAHTDLHHLPELRLEERHEGVAQARATRGTGQCLRGRRSSRRPPRRSAPWPPGSGRCGSAQRSASARPLRPSARFPPKGLFRFALRVARRAARRAPRRPARRPSVGGPPRGTAPCRTRWRSWCRSRRISWSAWLLGSRPWRSFTWCSRTLLYSLSRTRCALGRPVRCSKRTSTLYELGVATVAALVRNSPFCEHLFSFTVWQMLLRWLGRGKLPPATSTR